MVNETKSAQTAGGFTWLPVEGTSEPLDGGSQYLPRASVCLLLPTSTTEQSIAQGDSESSDGQKGAGELVTSDGTLYNIDPL